MFLRSAGSGNHVSGVEEESGRDHERADRREPAIPCHSSMQDGLTRTRGRQQAVNDSRVGAQGNRACEVASGEGPEATGGVRTDPGSADPC